MARLGIAVGLLVASVLLSGCIGDDDAATRSRPGGAGTPTLPGRSGEAPTKRKFVQAASRVCARARRRLAPIYEAIDAKVASQDIAGVAVELRKALPVADELLRRMRALTPPRGDEATVGRYLRTVAEQRRRIRSLVNALEAEDLSTAEVLVAQLRRANRRAQRRARDYGFRRCSPPDLPAG